MTAVHRETFRVRAGEVGPGGAMRLPALLDLFQEAAGNSATSFGWGSDALLAQGKTWVLSRHHLRLHALPAWREDVAVETWPSDANFLLFRPTTKPAGAVWSELVAASVLVRDCSSWPGLTGCLRVTVGLPEENDRFLAALTESLR